MLIWNYLLKLEWSIFFFKGSTQDSFKNSNDPVVKRVYEEKKHEVPNDEHRSYEEDVMRYQGQKMAFLRTEGMIRTFKGYPCEIAAIPGQVYAQYYGGIALSKNSDLLPLISHFLLKFKQTGHLEKWHKQVKAHF